MASLLLLPVLNQWMNCDTFVGASACSIVTVVSKYSWQLLPLTYSWFGGRDSEWTINITTLPKTVRLTLQSCIEAFSGINPSCLLCLLICTSWLCGMLHKDSYQHSFQPSIMWHSWNWYLHLLVISCGVNNGNELCEYCICPNRGTGLYFLSVIFAQVSIQSHIYLLLQFSECLSPCLVLLLLCECFLLHSKSLVCTTD